MNIFISPQNGGFLYLAQGKWRNGDNNRTLTLNLSLTLPQP